MTAFLCPTFPEHTLNASEFTKFFSEDERRIIRSLEAREQLFSCDPKVGCQKNLFFGFFFDGTKNNYIQAEETLNHSNVARLYDCYPGTDVPEILPTTTKWQHQIGQYNNFFKTYIPGVSSPFEQVNDDGKITAGGAFGYLGEPRIVWALIQAINHVHRYFHGSALISPKEERWLVFKISIVAEQRRGMTEKSSPGFLGLGNWLDSRMRETREQFTLLLKRLHYAVSPYWPDRKTGKPKNVTKGIVKKIFFSTFGFSRGATQARAFTNWLMALCTLDAELSGRSGTLTLGGFDVKFDFLGLFDTVASVGLGNTLGNSLLGRMLDGHSGWADSEFNLRIPRGVPCVHLVAAHEIRRSFPVDSISVRGALQEQCEEVVFPGVHSDVGCGYSPKEQGRGTDAYGSDMLSRFPLLYMYRKARLAGVPLKLEFASGKAKERFAVARSALISMNAYLASCAVKNGSLTSIMREQAKLNILWRKARRPRSATPLEKTSSFERASTFDKNDLHSANLEFEEEIKLFESWLSGKGKKFIARAQSAGFDDDHEKEWEEIAIWWHKAPVPPEAVLNLFDNYVHDSRAWFKLKGDYPDNEAKLCENLRKWEERRKRIAQYNETEKRLSEQRTQQERKWYGKSATPIYQPFKPIPDGLTDQQRNAAMEYARTGRLPRMITDGREPYYLGAAVYPRAGYLRFRKVYAGGDNLLLSDAGAVAQQNTALA